MNMGEICAMFKHLRIASWLAKNPENVHLESAWTTLLLWFFQSIYILWKFSWILHDCLFNHSYQYSIQLYRYYIYIPLYNSCITIIYSNSIILYPIIWSIMVNPFVHKLLAIQSQSPSHRRGHRVRAAWMKWSPSGAHPTIYPHHWPSCSTEISLKKKKLPEPPTSPKITQTFPLQ